MGYSVPSPYNKINIHIGGVYGGKQKTLARFARNLARLSPACRARLTVENDDTPNAFSLEDLLPMAHEHGVPLVFDFHHYKFIASTCMYVLHLQFHDVPRSVAVGGGEPAARSGYVASWHSPSGALERVARGADAKGAL